MKYFNLSKDERGVATLVFDTPEKAVNVLCFDALYELEQHLKELENDHSVKALFPDFTYQPQTTYHHT